MSRSVTIIIFPLIILIMLISPSVARAESLVLPNLEGNPYDVISAVNALRASNGLTAYSISSTLMYTAQAQADFMAATGNVTHTGPGGISVTDRLLAAGYPLAGDLSLGGFRSENIMGGSESTSAQAAVNSWTGDAPHLNTMLSPDLTEIGAGVAMADGRAYYVIDCARPTTSGASGAPQASTQVGGSGSAVPAGEAPIPVVIVSTPNAEGDVIHEVLPGQSLWQIAIAYNVKINDIKSLNNLLDNNIYPGDKLLIKKGQVAASATPAETGTNEPTASPTIVLVSTATALLQANLTSTPGSVSSTTPNTSSTIMTVVMGIIALALLGGGIFTWLGNSNKE